MRKSMRVAAAATTLALTGLGLVACSSGSGGNGGGGGSAKDIGPITIVQGKDNNGALPKYAALWNKSHPKEKITFKEQSDQADQQLNDLLLHFKQKSTDYDVVSTDVVWTQQLASQQYLQPLTGQYKLDTAGLLPSVLKTATYHGTLYAAPAHTDSQILYYRKDLLGKNPVPTTYADMFKLCDIAKKAKINCYTGQFAKYEGLTVNVAEAINSAGGTIVDANGKPTLDTPQAKAGLTTLVNAFKNGDIPQSAITNQEEQGRAAFEAGKYLFYTNWPYAYSLTTTDPTSVVKNKFGISGFPGKSSLGGHNWAISAFSKHKGTALKFIKWFSGPEIQKLSIQLSSAAPVRGDLYTDSTLTKKFPYLPTLKQSLDTAVPRPGSPYYQAVTTAIQDNAYAALKGNKSVDQALKDMGSAISQAGS